MAKKTIITTGDTETLKTFWEFANIMKIGRIVDQALAAITNSLNQAVTSSTTNGVITQRLASGETITISPTAATENGQATRASKWTYTFSNGVVLDIEGKLTLDENGKLTPASKITKVNMVDAQGILYGVQSQGTTTATGDINFTSAAGLTEVIFRLNAFERSMTIGSNNYSGTFGFINRIEKSMSNGNWSASGVIDSFTLKEGASPLLKIENLNNDQLNANDPAVIEALSSAEKFIAYYLSGNDNIKATDTDTLINGYAGNDTITGGSGKDTLLGSDGNDTLSGGNGNDILTGGNGNDNVNAGEGNDMIVGGDGAGNDSYDGGKGIDTVKYTSAMAGITVDMAKGTASSSAGGDTAGIGTDKLKGIENLIAGNYADTLIGSKDANVIEGRSGNDTIDGGLGSDTLIGGAGADRFFFSTKPAANNIDTISDFEVGIDKLVLSAKIFAKLKGITDFTPYFAISTAADANDFLIYDPATGRLSYDADGSGKGKATEIAILVGAAGLVATDLTMS